jgi:hypothetical protein
MALGVALALVAAVLAAGLPAGISVAGGAAPTPKPKGRTAPAPRPAAPAPAPAPTPPPPGAAELAELSFLAGNWRGAIDNLGMRMDITIKGATDSTGRSMHFRIHAVPGPGINLGIQGDYNAVLSWSARFRALRALVTDADGRGVELTGARVAGSREWLFSSTSEGSPFPFKVRLKPASPDQLVLDYTSGGRIVLNYQITFNRVAS